MSGSEGALAGRARPGRPAAALGGALAACLLVLALAGALAGSTVDWPLFAGRLAGELLVPAVGLGFAAALGGDPLRGLALPLMLGAGLGEATRAFVLQTLTLLPNAATHAFLTGPIAGLGVGAALFLLPGRAGRLALALAALLSGAMASVAVRLLDPSFHDPAVPVVGLAGLLVPLLLALGGARALPEGAGRLAARILGAWVLAIALLYGGATLAFRGRAVPPDATGRAGPAEQTPFPDFGPGFAPQPGSAP